MEGFRYRIIKATNQFDNNPIGLLLDINGSIPLGYIEYKPNKIFDRRKYIELYKLFGKDHLPSENEIKLYQQKLLRDKKVKKIVPDMMEEKENIFKRIMKKIRGK